MWSQAAGFGEENLLWGQWGACRCVWDEETGRFVPGEAGGTEKENFLVFTDSFFYIESEISVIENMLVGQETKEETGKCNLIT